MATSLKYNLKQITDISLSGFQYEISDETFNMINYLSSRLSSPPLTDKIFSKQPAIIPENKLNNNNLEPFVNKQKKRKGNKHMEATEEEWETIRTFQTTKIEQKSGIEADIDQIRLLLNKLTDKTFLDIREKIIDKINSICSENPEKELLTNIGNIIYDLSSTNKFYSKIFADLFAELASMHSWISDVFKDKYSKLSEQYNNIKYVDSEEDYDGFCEMNKLNEKRKSITTFYLNLSLNNFIEKNELLNVMRYMLNIILEFIKIPDKKAEVDELTENVAILFNKTLLDKNDSQTITFGERMITIQEAIVMLSKTKAKDFPSLSNKSIFKYMDLVEM